MFLSILIGAFALGQGAPALQDFSVALGAAGFIYDTIDRVSIYCFMCSAVICVCVCACVCTHMCVCMCACMHASMYVCIEYVYMYNVVHMCIIIIIHCIFIRNLKLTHSLLKDSNQKSLKVTLCLMMFTSDTQPDLMYK